MRLLGKVAVVTGAGSGMGQAIALAFASQGAAVACIDMDMVGLDATVVGAAEFSGTIVPLEADVSSWSSIERAVASAEAQLGPIEIAVANAGISTTGTAVATELDDWNRVLAVNLTGTWLTARAVLPSMRRHNGGSIINIASASALVGMRAVAAYSAAKAGVVGLTRQMAADFARDNVRVNAIAPGLTETPMLHAVYEDVQAKSTTKRSVEERVADAARAYPLGRLGIPSDIASAALFLASDESSWITAIVLPVDGGFVAV